MSKLGKSIDHIFGHVEPWWDAGDIRILDYVNEPFNDSQTTIKWQKIGFQNKIFTGEMYNMTNDEPWWIHPFRDHFICDHFGWTVYKMQPGRVLPRHGDLFKTYIDKFKIKNKNNIFRAVVFLEDWKSGHYLEVNDEPMVKWKAGDYALWRFNTPHLAVNCGFEDRYTLQITGVER